MDSFFYQIRFFEEDKLVQVITTRPTLVGLSNLLIIDSYILNVEK
jgi:hypothetical protein